MVEDELQIFKRRIDLRQYAASLGYQKDFRESTKRTDVMRHSNGDKIHISLGSDRSPDHWVYYSYHDDGDNGTIVDFVKKRLNLSLGAIRKELRPWIGKPPVSVPVFPPPVQARKDHLDVESEFAKMQDAPCHPYLVNERSIPFALLSQDRFAGRIRIDRRGNAMFPHFNKDVLSGYEIKNKNFTGFSPNGSKGLWLSQSFQDDRRIVFCESAIDALSYAVIFPDLHTRYASIGGKLNPTQPDLIRAEICRMPPSSEVVAAMDADSDGAKLAEGIRRAGEGSGRADLRFIVHEPFGYKDWNDQLRGSRKTAPLFRMDKPSVG